MSLMLEAGAGILRRAVAAAGDHQCRGAGRVFEADMEGGEAAHAQAHHMGALNVQVVEDGDRIRHRMGLAVGVCVLRHV